MRSLISIAGSIAQRPGNGGHTWVFLQYVLGLRRLGWDVLLLDRLEPSMCLDDAGRRCPPAVSRNRRYFDAVMGRFGLAEASSLLLTEDGGGRASASLSGLSRDEVLRRVRDAELLINVMGFLDDPEVLDAARRRVFLDIDPGFGQMWRELGLADLFAGHHDFVTIGRNVGEPGCAIPDCGLSWVTTAQPVVLEHWPVVPGRGGPFTSVATWRGPFAPIEYRGVTYGLRVHGFRELAPLPRLSDSPFEIALDIDMDDEPDRRLLVDNDWTLVEPRTAAGSPDAYRRYISRSGAEFMVAKDIYVRSNSGWFSDRSTCYLASGRPVVAQDTGLDGNVPTGEGLLAYRTLEEARDAVDRVSRDWDRHARAARRVAEECFDSDRVLGSLLGRLGVDGPR